MKLLIIGLLLWVFSHTYKRLFPGLRARIGEEPGKGIAALAALAIISAYVETVSLNVPDFALDLADSNVLIGLFQKFGLPLFEGF